jgi:hypothetical protein
MGEVRRADWCPPAEGAKSPGLPRADAVVVKGQWSVISGQSSEKLTG